MGWSREHIHSWVIWTDVRMPVEAEVPDRDDMVVEVPFCAWICKCGAWKWRVSPEVLDREVGVEI